jgi:hypothetical protein
VTHEIMHNIVAITVIYKVTKKINGKRSETYQISVSESYHFVVRIVQDEVSKGEQLVPWVTYTRWLRRTQM